MKKNVFALKEIKSQIAALKGNTIELKINRGRKKYETFPCTIDNVYPSVFTVKVNHEKKQENQTFSYFDVLCGDVIILEKTI